MPLATALIIAAAAYAANSNKEGTEETTSQEDINPSFLQDKSPIELLPLEQKLTIFEQPISTVSFYDCSSLSLEEAKSIPGKLKNRVDKILTANPWLGGWLVRGKGVGSFDNTHRLWYDPSGRGLAPTIFQELKYKDVPVGRSTPFVEYETVLGGKSTALVKNNPLVVNRMNEPLFRVTIVLETEGGATPDGSIELDSSGHDVNSTIKGFTLIVSMSHICGDAHTYYRIHNMLLGIAPVTALIPTREQQFNQKVIDLMGKQEAHYVTHVSTDPAWAKLFRMSSSIEDDPESELKGRVFTINPHWVGNIKAQSLTSGNISDLSKSTMRSPMSNAYTYEMASQNPTQSTNDILVSWFWNLVRPDVGMMAVNLRDRIDLISNNHVGNYNNPISYAAEDYKSPQLIRQSLKLCKRAGVSDSGGSTVLPRPNPEVTFSIVTNWSSFSPLLKNSEEDVEDTCNWNARVELVRHLPLIYPKQMMSFMPRRMSFMVIFSSGEDVGCVVMAPGRVMGEIDGCGVVKEMIAEF